MMKEEEIRKLAEDYIDSCTKKSGFVILAESLKGDFINLFVAGFMKCLEINKENEWHYVKDELPKDGVQVLSEKGHLVIYKGDCFCWFEYSPNADNIKLRKWEEPIAWKEIVLPELKESE